jgi:hypothetical protein
VGAQLIGTSKGAGEDDKGNRSYTRTYRIYTTQPSDEFEVLQANPFIPGRRQPHQSDPLAFVSHRRADWESRWSPGNGVKGARWIVTIEYSTSQSGEEYPWQDPPEVTSDELPFDEIRDFEIKDDNTFDLTKPIRDSAYSPFDPPVLQENSKRVIRVTRNVQSLNEALYEQFRYRCNSGSWNGLADGTVLCKPVRTARPHAVINGVKYRYGVESWEFVVNGEGWEKHKQPNMGLAYWNAPKTQTNPKPALLLANQPVFLNTDGTKRDPTQTQTPLEFKVRAKTSFAPLNMLFT